MEHLSSAHVLPLFIPHQLDPRRTQILPHPSPEMFHAHTAFLNIINFTDHLKRGVREGIYII